MITRPLDLASRLRPPPRTMDGVFYANMALLGLFFALFGSRFVISPSIELEGTPFSLPTGSRPSGAGMATTSVISVLGPDMVFTAEGRMTYAELRRWLPTQVARGAEADSRLLVRADARVAAQDLAQLSDLAREAGFSGVQLALENPQDALRVQDR